MKKTHYRCLQTKGVYAVDCEVYPFGLIVGILVLTGEQESVVTLVDPDTKERTPPLDVGASRIVYYKVRIDKLS